MFTMFLCAGMASTQQDKKFYSDIIENTKQVSIEPGEDEKVIELIEKQIEE